MNKKILYIISIWYILLSTFSLGYVSLVNADNDFSSKDFSIDISKLSPWENPYTNWPKENISNVLNKITQLLLVIIPALASIFIVVWWIKMITSGWDSSKISSAKNIITYNIVAIVIALLSYSIIQLIIWLIWSKS